MGAVTSFNLSVSKDKELDNIKDIDKNGKYFNFIEKGDDFELFIYNYINKNTSLEENNEYYVYITDKYDDENGILFPLKDIEEIEDEIDTLSYYKDEYTYCVLKEENDINTILRGYLFKKIDDIYRIYDPDTNNIINSNKLEINNKLYFFQNTPGIGKEVLYSEFEDIYYDSENKITINISKEELYNIYKSLPENGKLTIEAESNGVN